jgi:hypothetical protein
MFSSNSSGSTFRYFSTSYYTISSCLASFSELSTTIKLSFFFLRVEVKLPFSSTSVFIYKFFIPNGLLSDTSNSVRFKMTEFVPLLDFRSGGRQRAHAFFNYQPFFCESSSI